MNVSYRLMDGTKDWGWVKARLDLLRVEDTSGIIAEELVTGKILAACILDTWTVDAVACHVIIDNPMVFKYHFAERVFGYVFEVRNKTKMIGSIPSNNRKALKLNKHLGFEEVATIADVFGNGVGCTIMQLERKNCKYLDNEVTHG